jgi:hypothetical protein
MTSGVVDDRLEFRYRRAGPADSVAVEALTIGLGGAIPGQYELTVTVIDEFSGNAVRRTRGLVVY